ncbi:MAG: Na(+)-translocating NADH-quinone reductase subunit A [Catalinimonas sp.]
MSKNIRLKRGLDLNLAGKPQPHVSADIHPEVCSVKPTDFLGIGRQKVLVQEGDTVKAGTPVFNSKTFPRMMFTAPVSGEVVEIERGAKRKLIAVKILADQTTDYEAFTRYTPSDLNSISREAATEQLLDSGLWPHLLQRPFNTVADPDTTPKAIFMSGFDTHPLAPNLEFACRGDEQYLQAGVNVLRKFTTGTFHVNLSVDTEASSPFAQLEGVQINRFAGKHPAGCVGVQIHHLDPMNKGEVAWTISPQGVIQIGKLFLDGRVDTRRLVALSGSEVTKPQYYRLPGGASIKKLVESTLKQENVRFVSGNPLTGYRMNIDEGIGYYHNQVSVLPEGNHSRFLGWIVPVKEKISFQRAFGLLSYLNPKTKEYVLDTNTNGEERAFVQTGLMERVLPMDIYVEYLLKAIMAQDYDEMEALGIYEVVEEDLALCEFIDVSKMDVQAILREGLELMRTS